MIRIAKKTDPRKLEELKRKIHEEAYLSVAIELIAQNLTKSLLHDE